MESSVWQELVRPKAVIWKSVLLRWLGREERGGRREEEERGIKYQPSQSHHVNKQTSSHSSAKPSAAARRAVLAAGFLFGSHPSGQAGCGLPLQIGYLHVQSAK